MTKKKKQTAVRSRGTTIRASKYQYPIVEDPAETERFSEAIFAWNGLARAALESGRPQIGVLGEKSLHSIIKRYVTEEESCYEVPIYGNDGADKHRYIADICIGNRIYEIQTGSFYPLVPKISYYLRETDYDVTVVHPVPGIRYKVWIDPETGEVQSRKRSPKKGRAEDALREIFWIRDLLKNPRLHVWLLFLEEDEYRYLDGWSHDKKRGSNRCERVPAALLGSVRLNSAEDYRGFLMPELPCAFTATELGKLLGLRGKAIYSALKVLLATGWAEQIGMRGRSVLYRKTDLPDSVVEMSEVEAEELAE